MTPEQHKRLGELFDQLYDLPDGERARAIAGLHGSDAELRAKLERLLAGDAEASQAAFLDRPAIEDAAQLLVPNLDAHDGADTPAPGASIGAYRLVRRIGAGGMGVVYEAEDLKLHRQVAVKILPRSVAGPENERVQRFEREARAAGRLNHPNIASIYDAGFDKGYSYYAMELVPGSTLRELGRTNPGKIEEETLLDILGQIASALSAAHAEGIVHRDIKPENVIVRPDGLVKILDFGLARMREPSSNESLQDLRTRPGQLAGTVQYLSPEQVLGKPATPQSDIFSLGIVAYELASGARPFDGATDGAIFDAILHTDPPLASSRRAGLSAAFDQLVQQALEKDPELRFPTAAEFGRAVKRIARHGAPVRRPRSPRRSAEIALACGLLIGAVATFLAMDRLRLFSAVAPSPSQAAFRQLTRGTGTDMWPSVSADGSQFVFAAGDGGKTDIFLQRIEGSRAINLTRDFGAASSQPALSPDGTQIMFRSEQNGGGLFLMGSTGENPRRIAARGYFPAWSPDGRHIAFTTHTFTVPNQVPNPPSILFVLDLDTAAERQLQAPDAMQPNWSPHGWRIAYWGLCEGARRDIFTIDAAGKSPPVAVTADPALDWNPVWSRSGQYLWFLSDRGGTRNIWRVRIDERSGKTLGAPEAVTAPADSVESQALAGEGDTIVYSNASLRSFLMRIA